jgi:hypothetical protein
MSSRVSALISSIKKHFAADIWLWLLSSKLSIVTAVAHLRLHQSRSSLFSQKQKRATRHDFGSSSDTCSPVSDVVTLCSNEQRHSRCSARTFPLLFSQMSQKYVSHNWGCAVQSLYFLKYARFSYMLGVLPRLANGCV